MATKKYDYEEEVEEYHDAQPALKRIVIERREFIGEVVEDPTGKQSMVMAAFGIATEYVSDQMEGNNAHPVEVSFDFAGRRFKVGGEMVEGEGS